MPKHVMYFRMVRSFVSFFPSHHFTLSSTIALPPPITTNFNQRISMSSTTTTYLITGASRGLGLEYTRQLLTLDTSSKIIATARNPATATELNELSSKNEGRIKVIKLDVTDAEQVKVGSG